MANKSDLSKAIAEINKKYPDTPVLTGKSLEDYKIDKLKTGSIWLDFALDGGFPQGRTVELYGPPSSGKTMIALKTIVNAQKENKTCVFIDAEQAFDPQHAKKLGVDLDKLHVISESGGERVINMILKLLEQKPDIIVVDSVASLVPESEEEEPVEKQSMALQARLMSKALRLLTGAAARSNTLIIFINQIREQVGAYGNPEVTSGGRALSFYASVRVEIRRGQFIELKDTDDLPEDATADEKKRRVGQIINFKVVKSKISKPWTKGSFEYYYQGVINEADEIVSLLEYNRLIDKRGAYYYVSEDEKYQGRTNFAIAINQNKELKAKMLKLLNLK